MKIARRVGGRALTPKERETIKGKNILLLTREKRLSRKKQKDKDVREHKEVNDAILQARARDKDWKVLSEHRERFGFEVTPEIFFRTCSDEEYFKEIERTWYKSLTPGKLSFPPEPESKTYKKYSGELPKSPRERELPPKPSLLEVKGYKVGSQGYPQNVKAFEKEVEKQAPHVRIDSQQGLRSKLERERERDAARLNIADMRTEKWVLDKLNSLRIPILTQIKRGKREMKILGMEGGDFSPVTIEWFRTHPADLIFLEKDVKTEARRWRGYLGGIKSKGGGRPRSKKTVEEKREAHKIYLRKRAAEARR